MAEARPKTMTGVSSWCRETPELLRTVNSLSAERRRKVVRVAKSVAMGMAMDSILGMIRENTLNIIQRPTPLLMTKSVKEMILAINRMKVKIKRFTAKVGTVSASMFLLIMWGRFM
jgi:hypothetical protein